MTTVPLQQLFVLNSEFMVQNAKALAARLAAKRARTTPVAFARRFCWLYGRPATEREVQLGPGVPGRESRAARGGQSLTRWEQYAQVLLSANEFISWIESRIPLARRAVAEVARRELASNRICDGSRPMIRSDPLSP